MSPCELERAVALATGESRREIRRRGFQPLLPEHESGGEVEDVTVIDWDAVDAERFVVFP